MKQRILSYRTPPVTGNWSQLVTVLLHCSTPKLVPNVALSSLASYRMFPSLAWVNSSPSLPRNLVISRLRRGSPKLAALLSLSVVTAIALPSNAT